MGNVLIVGAGAVGLTAAVALAREGFDVTLVGRLPAPRPGRTVALLQGSVALLERLGAWPRLAGDAAPLRTMRLVDATGSLFRAPPVAFRAAEIGADAFGYNVDNADLEAALRAVAAASPSLALVADNAAAFTFHAGHATVTTGAGRHFDAALLVAADGRASPARRAARIGVRTTNHPQVAITALLAHTVPHRDVSTEYHTREGPFTLVPLPRGVDGGHRSSLVWVMSPFEAERRGQLAPEAFAGEAERQCRRALGAMRVEGATGTFPIVTSHAARLVGPRLALIGEAAHALPPIGAQGLNLSFRDVAALTEHLRAVRDQGGDIGGDAALGAYARGRAGDIAGRSLGVGLLNRSLLSANPAVDALRGLGLAALDGVGPLRRLVMRRGLAPGDAPRAAPP